MRDKTIESSDNKQTAENTYKELPKQLQKEAQPRYSLPLNTDGNVEHTLTETAVPVEDISSQVITDSVGAGQQTVSFNVDSLEKVCTPMPAIRRNIHGHLTSAIHPMPEQMEPFPI